MGRQATGSLQVSHVHSFKTLCCHNTIHFTCALLENLKFPCPVKYDSLLINAGLGSKQIGKKLLYVSSYFFGFTCLCLNLSRTIIAHFNILKCMQNNVIQFILFACSQWSLSTVSYFTFLLTCLKNKCISKVTK